MENDNKVFLVCDADNLWFLQKDLDFHIDPSKLRTYCEQFGEIVDANWYMSVFEEISDGKTRFMKALSHMGYRVVSQLIKHIYSDEGFRKDKANMDIKVCVDVLTGMNNFDTLILVSGDGDFRPMLETLLANGKQFKVISCDGLVAKELREIAGMHYINMLDIKDKIEKDRRDDTDI